jgi:hypothetical protein
LIGADAEEMLTLSLVGNVCEIGAEGRGVVKAEGLVACFVDQKCHVSNISETTKAEMRKARRAMNKYYDELFISDSVDSEGAEVASLTYLRPLIRYAYASSSRSKVYQPT